jgi:hypothetical protein
MKTDFKHTEAKLRLIRSNYQKYLPNEDEISAIDECLELLKIIEKKGCKKADIISFLIRYGTIVYRFLGMIEKYRDYFK